MEGKKPSGNVETVGLNIKSKIDEVVKQANIKNIEQENIVKNRILNVLGSTDTYESIGMKVQGALAQRSKLVTEKGRELYTEVGKYVPKGTKVEMPTLQNTAKVLLERESNLPPTIKNRSVETMLESFSGMAGEEKLPANFAEYSPAMQETIKKEYGVSGAQQYDWQTLQDIRSDLGDKIRSTDPAYNVQMQGEQKMLSNRIAGIYKQLKSSLQTDIDNFFTMNPNKEAKDAYDAANIFWREEKQIFNKPEVIRMMKVNPDKIVDMAIRPNSVVEIKNLKKAVGPQSFDILKQKFVNKLFDKVSRTDFSWEKVASELRRYGNETLTELFTPNELNVLDSTIASGIKRGMVDVTNPFLNKILKYSTPDTIFNLVFHPNNSLNILKVKDVVGNDLFNEAKNVFTQKVLQTNEFGLYRPLKGVKNFSKFSENDLKSIYKPEELSFLKDIIDLSKKSMGAERVAGNPSGTAQSIITFEAGRAILRNPITGSSYWLAPVALAKMYYSKLGRQYFTTGFRMPFNVKGATELYTKILSIAGTDAIEINKNQENIVQ
jgi:hypothetical protein